MEPPLIDHPLRERRFGHAGRIFVNKLQNTRWFQWVTNAVWQCSLSISQEDDVRILLHRYADCSIESIARPWKAPRKKLYDANISSGCSPDGNIYQNLKNI